jgi:tetratricopeptide (TPR) repeat protein
LKYTPDHPLALNNLAMILGEAGEFAQAEDLLQRLLRQHPDNVTVLVNLGKALHLQKKLDEAIACCERGLKLSPENRELLNTLALSLDAAGRYEEAIALLNKMVRRRPGYAKGHYYLGTLHNRLGHCDEAVAHFNKATSINPADGASFVGAGECLLLHGRSEEALAQIDRALRVKTYDVRALALKTLALAELGRKEEEKWLSDPFHFIHMCRITDFGYSQDQVAALNRALSEFASSEPSLREDPPEYATANSWHSTTNLMDSGNPAVEELTKFMAYALEDRRRGLSREDPSHPFVRGAPGDFRIDLWAVKQMSGSKMLPHIHVDGWLSASYYVDVPGIVNDPAAGEAGWIKFGTPRIDIKLTKEPLTRTIKPEPGLLVTFPSYFWHDTVPLPANNREQRLVLAFDWQPIRAR